MKGTVVVCVRGVKGGVWKGLLCPCPAVRDDIVTPRYLLSFICIILIVETKCFIIVNEGK